MKDHGGWIATFSGRQIWPLEPDQTGICIEDIAHSLAHQCRFNGHCRRFYSVAEHSLELSRLIESGERRVASGRGGEKGEWIEENENQKSEIINHKSSALWGLMHDAAEAYLGDVVRPLKSRSWFAPESISRPIFFHTQYGFTKISEIKIKTYRVIEERLLEVIAERFHMHWPMPVAIREADDRMLATELAQLFDFAAELDALDGIEPFSIQLRCLDPIVAEREFLARFAELCG